MDFAQVLINQTPQAAAGSQKNTSIGVRPAGPADQNSQPENSNQGSFLAVFKTGLREHHPHGSAPHAVKAKSVPAESPVPQDAAVALTAAPAASDASQPSLQTASEVKQIDNDTAPGAQTASSQAQPSDVESQPAAESVPLAAQPELSEWLFRQQLVKGDTTAQTLGFEHVASLPKQAAPVTELAATVDASETEMILQNLAASSAAETSDQTAVSLNPGVKAAEATQAVPLPALSQLLATPPALANVLDARVPPSTNLPPNLPESLLSTADSAITPQTVVVPGPATAANLQVPTPESGTSSQTVQLQTAGQHALQTALQAVANESRQLAETQTAEVDLTAAQHAVHQLKENQANLQNHGHDVFQLPQVSKSMHQGGALNLAGFQVLGNSVGAPLPLNLNQPQAAGQLAQINPEQATSSANVPLATSAHERLDTVTGLPWQQTADLSYGIRGERLDPHQAQASKAQVTSAELVERFQVMRQLTDKIQLMQSSRQHAIQLTLHPADLGRMSLRLQQDAQQLHLHILTEFPLTKELIESQLHTLRQQLHSQGLHLQQVSIDVQPDWNQARHPGQDQDKSAQQGSQPQQPDFYLDAGTDNPAADELSLPSNPIFKTSDGSTVNTLA